MTDVSESTIRFAGKIKRLDPDGFCVILFDGYVLGSSLYATNWDDPITSELERRGKLELEANVSGTAEKFGERHKIVDLDPEPTT